MNSREMSRRIGLLLGGAAIVGMAATSAGCSKEEEKPTKTPEPTKSSVAPSPSASSPAPPPSGAPASPTEKAPTLTPGGPNSFTPSVLAPKAPTALPGNVITGGG